MNQAQYTLFSQTLQNLQMEKSTFETQVGKCLMFVLLMNLLCIPLRDAASADADEKTLNVTVQLEAFERGNRDKRFLTCERQENGKALTVSFTGKKDEPGTRFIMKTKWTTAKTMEFTLQPAEFPDYVLCAQGGSLVAKNVSKASQAPMEYTFEMKRVTLQYRDSKRNKVVTEVYRILRTRSRPPRILKSSKSGKVLLQKWKNWRDCQTWFKIESLQ